MEYEKIFKYGLHDIILNDIEIVSNDKVAFTFDNGVYNLDENGTETDLTKKCKLIIKIKKFDDEDKLENYIFIVNNSLHKSKIISTEKLRKILKNKIVMIGNIYFSFFNSEILIDAGYKSGYSSIQVSSCIDAEYLFEDENVINKNI